MSQDIDYHIEAKYKVIEKIGSGAYGHVFKVINRKTKKVKALKKNFDAFHNSTDAQRTYREITILMQLHHQNIIELDEVFIGENGKDVYIVFEYMDADLHYVIRKKILTQRHIKYITYQAANALLYMHSAELIHRDIKPSNILINDSCQVKLCDFGLVRSIDHIYDEQYDILTQYIATRWYRAPQIILGSKKYSTKIDVWSFGCTLAQIVRGKPLFPGTSTLNQLQRILKWTGLPTQSDIKSLKINISKQILDQASKTRPHKASNSEYFNQIDPQCLDLIQKCLEFNPEKRISFQEIVKHPYLSEFYSKSDIIRSKKRITTPVDDNSRMNLKIYRSLINQLVQKKFKISEDLHISIKQVRPHQPTIFRVRQTKKQIKTQPADNHYQFFKSSSKEQKPVTVSLKCPQIPKKSSFLLQKTPSCQKMLSNFEVIGFNANKIIKNKLRQSNDEKKIMTKKRQAISKLGHQQQAQKYLRETSTLKMYSKKKHILIKQHKSVIQDKATII